MVDLPGGDPAKNQTVGVHARLTRQTTVQLDAYVVYQRSIGRMITRSVAIEELVKRALTKVNDG